ncbi:MAG TPA: Gfo/Idh/MocA family oxidoreductase [Candidatus Cybelea sp.]|nr:Gfo/Idh/MocA family oxidoreductase [Candidatus Cybelea sp.]
MKPIRIGISGAGFGAVAHLPALQNHPGFEVVAIASPSSAAKVAQAANVGAAFESCEAMLAGCELDAVTVASPPFTHHHDTIAALRAGKHVLCEKPFALNVAQAMEMREALRQAGTVGGIAHEFRFVSQVAAIAELVRNGHLGAVRDVESTMLRTNLRAQERRPRSWWFERERGGGLAGAVLSHLVDQANWLCGAPPKRAAGALRTANPHRLDDRGTFTSTVDDGAAAVLEYPGEVLARLCVDGTTAVESYTLAVHGERRTAVASGLFMTQLSLYTIDGDVTEELTCKPSPYAAFESVNHNVPLLMELYDEFQKAVEGEPNALPSFDDGVATQEVLAAIGYGA